MLHVAAAVLGGERLGVVVEDAVVDEVGGLVSQQGVGLILLDIHGRVLAV